MTANASFPKQVRLRKRREFLAVQSKGRRVSGLRFIMLSWRRQDDEVARLGITISSKVGNAVIRNRIRRLVREVFRADQARWPRGHDVVVIARAAARGATRAEIAQELGMLLRKVRA